MADQSAVLAELVKRRDQLPPDKQVIIDELVRRQNLSSAAPAKPENPIGDQLSRAQEWVGTQAVSAGKNFLKAINPIPAAKLAYRLSPLNLANFSPNDPNSTANTVRQLVGDPIVRGVTGAYQEGMAGRPLNAVNEMIYGTPLVGPAIESVTKKAETGDYGGAVGEIVGGVAGPKMISKAIKAVPKAPLVLGVQRSAVDFPKVKNPEPSFLEHRNATLAFQRQQGWSSSPKTAQKGGSIDKSIATWKPQVTAGIAKAEAAGAPGVSLHAILEPMLELRKKTSYSMFPENSTAIETRIGAMIDVARGPQVITRVGSNKPLKPGTAAYYKELAQRYQPDNTVIPLGKAQMLKENTDQWVRDNMFAETQPVGIEAVKRGESVLRKEIATQAPDVVVPNRNIHQALTLQTAILRKLQSDPGFAKEVLPFVAAGGALELFGHSTYAQTAIAAALVRAASKSPVLMSRLAILMDRAGTGPISRVGPTGARMSVVEQNRANQQEESTFPRLAP
jgi:hypothetical protein